MALAYKLERIYKSKLYTDFYYFNYNIPIVFSSIVGFLLRIDRYYLRFVSR